MKINCVTSSNTGIEEGDFKTVELKRQLGLFAGQSYSDLEDTLCSDEQVSQVEDAFHTLGNLFWDVPQTKANMLKIIDALEQGIRFVVTGEEVTYGACKDESTEGSTLRAYVESVDENACLPGRDINLLVNDVNDFI